MKRWLGIVIMLVVAIPVLAYGIGMFVPRDHVVMMTIDLNSPPEKVWAVVSDVTNTHKWRSDITGIQVQPGAHVRPRYVETSSMGDVPFEVGSQTAPARQVVRVVDDEQPFGGTWTWELKPAGPGTRLTITEAGFVKSPLFRTMGLFFFSPTDTIDGYMRALSKALGETAGPRR